MRLFSTFWCWLHWDLNPGYQRIGYASKSGRGILILEVNSHLDLLSCFIDIDMQSTIFPQPDERQVGWTCVQKISINGDEKVTRILPPFSNTLATWLRGSPGPFFTAQRHHALHIFSWRRHHRSDRQLARGSTGDFHKSSSRAGERMMICLDTDNMMLSYG